MINFILRICHPTSFDHFPRTINLRTTIVCVLSKVNLFGKTGDFLSKMIFSSTKILVNILYSSFTGSIISIGRFSKATTSTQKPPPEDKYFFDHILFFFYGISSLMLFTFFLIANDVSNAWFVNIVLWNVIALVKKNTQMAKNGFQRFINKQRILAKNMLEYKKGQLCFFSLLFKVHHSCSN